VNTHTHTHTRYATADHKKLLIWFLVLNVVHLTAMDQVHLAEFCDAVFGLCFILFQSCVVFIIS